MENGALDWKDAYRELVGPRPPEDKRLAIQIVRSAIARARTADPKQYADRSLWAGPLQLMATVTWFRRPLYVMDVGTDGQAYTQRYSLARSKIGTEYVRHDLLTPQETYVNFATFISQEVLPMILVLEHIPGPTAATTTGHYNALRFSEEAYAQWRVTDANKDAYQARLTSVYKALGLHVPSPDAPPQDVTPAASYDAESSYVPSQDLSSGDESTPPRRAPRTSDQMSIKRF